MNRAGKAGRLSATRTDTDRFQVDPAERLPVFPPVASQQGAHDVTPQAATAVDRVDNALHDKALGRAVRRTAEKSGSRLHAANSTSTSGKAGPRVNGCAMNV